MGRPLRVDVGGYVYHALNRASARATLFQDHDDYRQFEQVLDQARARTGMRILAYCLMPNHWHLVLWPQADGTLGRFMTWLTLTHTQRWHARRGSAGAGHLYQGRYKSFLVQADEHLLSVCRYVERNPRRARLVRRAEAWRWGSLWRREHGRGLELLADWPVARPDDWRRLVNRAEPTADLEALRASSQRGRPFGALPWRDDIVRRFALGSTLRPRGRPPQATEKGSSYLSTRSVETGECRDGMAWSRPRPGPGRRAGRRRFLGPDRPCVSSAPARNAIEAEQSTGLQARIRGR